MRKVNSYEIHSPVEYIITCLVITIVGLFININVGLTFLSVCIFAPILSVGGMFLAMRGLVVRIHATDLVMQKGSKGFLGIRVENNSYIPLMDISIRVRSGYRVRYENPQGETLSVAGKSSVCFDKLYTAVIWGTAEIGVEEIVLTDLLKLISCTTTQANKANRFIHKVRIAPNIPNLISQSDFFQLSHSNENDEGDEDESPLTWNSENLCPGFQYRSYEPGDSLKMINWKLSEKEGKYVVRLLESVMDRRYILYFYPYMERNQSSTSMVVLQQAIVEGGLAILREFIMRKVTCQVKYVIHGIQMMQDIQTMDDLSVFQSQMVDFQFVYTSEKSIDPFWADQAPESSIILALEVSESLEREINKESTRGQKITVVLARPTADRRGNFYQMTEGYELVKMH
ncbi:MAG: DUF58 domain-containing protein [Lachnospiraceae bacterium]